MQIWQVEAPFHDLFLCPHCPLSTGPPGPARCPRRVLHLPRPCSGISISLGTPVPFGGEGYLETKAWVPVDLLLGAPASRPSWRPELGPDAGICVHLYATHMHTHTHCTHNKCTHVRTHAHACAHPHAYTHAHAYRMYTTCAVHTHMHTHISVCIC